MVRAADAEDGEDKDARLKSYYPNAEGGGTPKKPNGFRALFVS